VLSRRARHAGVHREMRERVTLFDDDRWHRRPRDEERIAR
jgi:hypothetical protein